MTRSSRLAGAVALAGALALAGAAPVAAWEADTTHAGLTEQAAQASALHERLRDQFGLEYGLFAPLTIPPQDAPPLFQILGRLNPTHGYVPDARGRQPAIGWLVAGSVVADVPVAAARNHFYDPSRNIGLRVIDPMSIAGLTQRLWVGLPDRLSQSVPGAGHGVGRRRALDRVGDAPGVAAIEWLRHADNPLALPGFYDQYRKAVRARTQGERDRHLAGALLAAGAVLHVLQDMGSPSHVRNDLAAHLQALSEDRTDVGSRFERVAALAYGRLGVPGPAGEITRGDVDSFFHADDGQGLADRTHRRWFSAGTLPRSFTIAPDAQPGDLQQPLTRALRYPLPAPVAAQLDLRAAARGGATLVDDQGVCLADYALDDARLVWDLSDDCALQQLGAILPTVTAYSGGLLSHLFRGGLAITADATGVTVGAADLPFGKGTVTVLADDGRLVRTTVAEGVASSGAEVGGTLARVTGLPSGARRVAALFEGVDASGRPLVAAGLLTLGE